MSKNTAAPEEPEDKRAHVNGGTGFSLSGNSNGDSLNLKALGVHGFGAFGKSFGGSAGAGGVISIGGGHSPCFGPHYPYDPSKTVIGPGVVPQPGILFPPPPYITPNDTVKGEIKMTDEDREKLVESILKLYKEHEEKKAEEDMTRPFTKSDPLEDPIMEPSPEASDRVYKIPYASGGPVGHPKVPTALHGLFYAMWIFASWVTLKPAILTVAAIKTAWKVPVAMYRGAAHAFYVTLPPAVLLILAALCLSGPRWVEPLMNWSGWGYDRHGDWVGFVLIFTFSLLGAAVWTIFHFAYRAAEHHWWWQEQK